jgi:hypothetical protein
MVLFLKVFLSFVWLGMIWVVVSTSLESSLFDQWNFLGGIPWMRATLWDFYANILLIYLWILWRERNPGLKILWAALLLCLGSIASIGYVLIQLFTLSSDDDDLQKLLAPKPGSR